MTREETSYLPFILALKQKQRALNTICHVKYFIWHMVLFCNKIFILK